MIQSIQWINEATNEMVLTCVFVGDFCGWVFVTFKWVFFGHSFFVWICLSQIRKIRRSQKIVYIRLVGKASCSNTIVKKRQAKMSLLHPSVIEQQGHLCSSDFKCLRNILFIPHPRCSVDWPNDSCIMFCRPKTENLELRWFCKTFFPATVDSWWI